MQTTCGGHLGWHEAPPNGGGGWGVGGSSSWADTAMADFIQAVLDTARQEEGETTASSVGERRGAQRRIPRQAELRSLL